jgi:hypothetical protein
MHLLSQTGLLISPSDHVERMPGRRFFDSFLQADGDNCIWPHQTRFAFRICDGVVVGLAMVASVRPVQQVLSARASVMVNVKRMIHYSI